MFGIQVFNGDRTLVSRNFLTGTRNPGLEGQGIRIVDSADVLVERNHVFRHAGDGVQVQLQDPLGAVVIRDNVLLGNGDDGIDVQAAGTVVTSNVANRNHDLGIEAVAGTIDLGGNKAFGNGNPLQCLNIACK
jgi:hypothetical protein